MSGTIEKYGKSRNLFDKDTYLIGGTVHPGIFPSTNFERPIQLQPNTTYTMSSNVPIVPGNNHLYIYNNSYSSASYKIVYKDNPQTITTGDDGVLLFEYAKRSMYEKLLDGTYYVMLNEGSTPLPYEPYGIFIPTLHKKKVNGAWVYDPQTYERVNGAWVSRKWSNIKALVDAGVHQQYFQVGDQLTCKRGNDTILWDIVDMAATDMTLLMHDCPFIAQFDAKEAMFAFENGLSAGTYHFTVTNQPWYPGDEGKTIQFTLTEAIPAGGQLVVQNAYNDTMISAKINSYASGSSTTAIESVTMSEGNDGTDLGSLTNAGTPASGINSVQRVLRGSNRWSTSAIRQFLNSDGAAGSVWIPQTPFDRPPSWVSSLAGFKNGLEADFLLAISANTNTTVLNPVSDGGGTETTTDMFYLPSRTEIYGTDEVSGSPEGTQYGYYVGTGSSAKIKRWNNSAVNWWLRTPFSSLAYTVHYINPSGERFYTIAHYDYRVAAACKIIKSP